MTIQDEFKIPDEWHKHSEFNCLTKEQFQLFQERHKVGDCFCVDDNDCECESYIVNGYHRCSCGNRRCSFNTFEYEGRTEFSIECW